MIAQNTQGMSLRYWTSEATQVNGYAAAVAY